MSSNSLQNTKTIDKKDTSVIVNSTKQNSQGQEKGKDTMNGHQINYHNGSFSQQGAIEIENVNEDVSKNIFPQAEQFLEQKQLKTNDRLQNKDWNCSFIDNLIQLRGQINGTVVPMELFIEVMHHLEHKISGMEQRIEDNEQQTKLNDRLFDLRNSLPQTQNIIANDLQTPLAKNKHSSSDFGGFNNQEQISKNLPSDEKIEKDSLKQQQLQLQEQYLQQIISQDNKLSMFDKKILHYEEIIHQMSSDIDHKFNEYGKKLNTQLDRFFKAAQQKMESFNEREQKINVFEENVSQQLELIKKTFLLKEEEFVNSKEDIQIKIQGSTKSCSRIENRLSEFGLEINETKSLLQQIEDDLFVVLQNHKDLQDAIYSYRSVFDEINMLKLTQTNVIQERRTSNFQK